MRNEKNPIKLIKKSIDALIIVTILTSIVLIFL